MKTIFIFISLILYTFSANSQDSLTYYLEQAALHNPEVIATYTDYLAAIEKVPQVGSLPDPQLTLGVFVKPMEQLMGNQVANIQLMQMFPWFGTLKASKGEALQMAQMKFEVFRGAKYDVYYNVKKTWYGIYRLNKEIHLTEQSLQLTRSLEQLSLSRFRSGGKTTVPGITSQNAEPSATSAQNSSQGMTMGSQTQSAPTSSLKNMSGSSAMGSSGGTGLADLLRIQMQTRELENKLALLNSQIETSIAELNKWLGRQPNQPVSVADTIIPEKIHIDEKAILDSIQQNNPMLKMIRAESASYEAKALMNKKMSYPMVGLGVQYMLINKAPDNVSMMNGTDMIMPMVSITLPIYRKKYNASVKEAKLLHEATANRKTDISNQLYIIYKEALQNYNDATRRINLYQGQTELAQKAQNLLITGLSNSGNSLDEVLQMQLQLLGYQYNLIEAIAEQQVAVAKIKSLTAEY